MVFTVYSGLRKDTYLHEVCRHLDGWVQCHFDRLVTPIGTVDEEQHEQEADQQRGQEAEEDEPPRRITCPQPQTQSTVYTMDNHNITNSL